MVFGVYVWVRNHRDGGPVTGGSHFKSANAPWNSNKAPGNLLFKNNPNQTKVS